MAVESESFCSPAHRPSSCSLGLMWESEVQSALDSLGLYGCPYPLQGSGSFFWGH